MGYRGRAAYSQGGTHTEQLPRLRSYAEALQYHNSVVPLRSGQHKDQRPLGRVRRYTRSIIRLEGGVGATPLERAATPDVVLSFYQNDVIRFKPDNTAHLSTCGWPSLSTMQFLNDILGSDRGCFVRKKGKIYYADGEQFHLLQHANMVIDLNTGEVSGGGSIDTYVLIKPEMHKVRKEYREFLQYAHNCLAMSVSVPLPAPTPNTNVYKSIPHIRVTSRTLQALTYRSNQNSGPKQCDIREQLFSSIKDTSGSPEDRLERYYEVFKTICLTTLHYLPYSYRYANSANHEFKCCRNYFDNLFTGMLKVHYADRLFQKTTFTSPMKKIPSTSNAFYKEFQNY